MQEALISYGPDEIDAYGRAADYVKRILDGSRVESLPVQLNSKFYLTLNLRRAKELGIGVPDRFLSQVDEEFE
jgi:putative ABC transport system substrate-binding protein